MSEKYLNLLTKKLDKENLDKLTGLNNPAIIDFVGEYVELCEPDSVFVRSDSDKDIAYIKERALSQAEETSLSLKGHSYHFDGPLDQARDKKNTKYLVADPQAASYLNGIERKTGLQEIRSNLFGIMKGKQMIVAFFCLGPVDSEFSILAVQITDSCYVAHSEDILYRQGYGQFKKSPQKSDFFKFVHSAGELENNVSKNVDQRRVYIDLENEMVYSTNTQYAGNTVGLKKLSLRLAIQRACNQDWLAEHMFLMGVSDSQGKKDYFCGAFPSMCGKTSTAMLQGETIIGDDIAYLRAKDDKAYAVNVERGIFGIIKDVNPKDDPVLFQALKTPGELIFSNILVDDKGVPFWIGKSDESPSSGVNFSGNWTPSSGPPSHKNARYTIKLSSLANTDEDLENPQGVPIKGLIYGGRDSDTSVPVAQAFSWQQGIIVKAAALESETTAATLGAEGVRVFNPMSNMDFLSVPLGKYIQANLDFGKKLKNPPLIFSVNYFLKNKQGNFLNAIQDKRVWLKWIMYRTRGKMQALETPAGFIPKYDDLKTLFKTVLRKEYSQDEYIEEFKLRIPENFAKIERIEKIYKGLKGIPQCVFSELDSQRARLQACQKEQGDYVSPFNFK